MKRVRGLHVLLAAGAFIALVVAFLLLPASRRLTPEWAAGGPCTVALNSHDMNVTATGSGARIACQSWLVRANAANPGGDFQCAYQRDGLTISVNDRGESFYGRNYCTHLKSWSESGGPIPDVDRDSVVPLISSSSPS